MTDTEILPAVRKEIKGERPASSDLGEIATIYAGERTPLGVMQPPRFLFLSDGRWEEYTIDGFVPVPQKELEDLRNSHRYVLVGPQDEVQFGRDLYVLFQKGP